jgi:hypothetical protein
MAGEPSSSRPVQESLSAWAAKVWMRFRRWPWWGQVIGWILGWWFLIPVAAWRSRLEWPLKAAVSIGRPSSHTLSLPPASSDAPSRRRRGSHASDGGSGPTPSSPWAPSQCGNAVLDPSDRRGTSLSSRRRPRHPGRSFLRSTVRCLPVWLEEPHD